MVSTVISTLALAASAAALTTSPAGTQNGCYWTVPSVGTYNTHFSNNFSTGASNMVTDLTTSIYTVASGNSPFARRFDATNMGYNSANGALTLTVPGGQKTGPISSAQLVTSYSDILFGSVRTVAMISATPGTTHGFTFYSNDTQEIDFAFLTSSLTYAHLTNEPTNGGDASTVQYAAPSDATTKFHEYRVDWSATSSSFFIDSVLVATITTNVPSSAGFWVWNNWSNGNSWAAGPPTSDSVLQIQSIDAYLNRTSVASSISSGATVCKVSSSSIASSSTSSVASSSSVASVKTTSSSSSSSVVPTTSAVSTAAAIVTSAVSSSSAAKVTSSSTTSSAASTATAKSTGAAEGAICAGLFQTAQTCTSGTTCTYSTVFASYCVADVSSKVSTKNTKSN